VLAAIQVTPEGIALEIVQRLPQCRLAIRGNILCEPALKRIGVGVDVLALVAGDCDDEIDCCAARRSNLPSRWMSFNRRVKRVAKQR
jgi:hypothetical protein